MKLSKKYFSNWNLVRISRVVLAVCLFLAYHFDGESMYLFVGIMLITQAVFNLSCAGGSCVAPNPQETKPIIKVDKYEPKNT